MKLKTKNIFLLLFFWLLFILNIWIINRGSGFTVPREMLFRNYADLKLPILIFPLVLLIFYFLGKYLFSFLTKVKPKTRTVIIFLLGLISAFSLFGTVQTNPDMGRYQVEAKYLAENGVVKFFKEWGVFYCPIDFPVIPFFYGLSYKIFGEGEWAVLLVNLFFFAGVLFFTYKIAEKLFNKKVATLSIILLSTTPFVLTQTPLFLVDIGQTFFLVLSIYLLIKNFGENSILLSFLTAVIISLASFTKGHAVLFFAPVFIFSLLKTFTDKDFRKNFFITWGLALILDLLALYLKKDWFLNWIFKALPTESFIASLLPLVIIGIALLVGLMISLKNKELATFIKEKIPGKYWLIGFYLIFIFLFIFGNSKAFYLRTPIPAMNIIVACLFYLSPFFIYKKHSKEGLFLLFWALTPLFIPNTMFKYQLPAYPAIMILASFSLASIAKTNKKLWRFMVLILAFSATITYFFFLPMINTHVKNNFRNAVRYADERNPNKIVLLFFPIGDYGQTLLKSLDKSLCSNPPTVLDLCPMPPSLVDIMDYYSDNKIIYMNNENFIKEIETGNIPDMVFLAMHMDVPTQIDPKIQEILNTHYQEGPLFDQAKGSGIWRVKIKVFSRLGQ
jgi:4-amino-4-deoxy-L-arabinose transferase-like glycosyltransferase